MMRHKRFRRFPGSFPQIAPAIRARARSNQTCFHKIVLGCYNVRVKCAPPRQPGWCVCTVREGSGSARPKLRGTPGTGRGWFLAWSKGPQRGNPVADWGCRPVTGTWSLCSRCFSAGKPRRSLFGRPHRKYNAAMPQCPLPHRKAKKVMEETRLAFLVDLWKLRGTCP